MKISLLTYLYSRYPLEHAFRLCAQQGYDGIELWGARPHAYPLDMTRQKIQEICRLKEKYGLAISMYTPEVLGYPYNLCSPNESERNRTVAYYERALDIARVIGAPRVQIAVGHAGYAADRRAMWRTMVDEVRFLAQKAEKVDVDVIVEALTAYESNMIVSCDDLVELLEDVGSPRVKGMLDTVPPMVHGEAMSDYFEKLGERMAYVHFVDAQPGTDYHAPYGTGIVPLEACVDMFRRFGYDGWLCVELLTPELRNAELYAGQAIRQLKKMLRNDTAEERFE